MATRLQDIYVMNTRQTVETLAASEVPAQRPVDVPCIVQIDVKRVKRVLENEAERGIWSIDDSADRKWRLYKPGLDLTYETGFFWKRCYAGGHTCGCYHHRIRKSVGRTRTNVARVAVTLKIVSEAFCF